MLYWVLLIYFVMQANRYEQVLAKRAEGISQNLHIALQTHNRLANDDITTALVEHARSTIMYEKQLLRELEALRPDVNNAAKKVTPQSNGIPRPSIIPPLEDFSKPPGPRSATVLSSNLSVPNRGPTPQSAAASVSAFARQPLAQQSSVATPPSQIYTRQGPLPPQSPGAGPSTSPAPSQVNFAPPPMGDGPPLGGKLIDGTKSMFVKSSSPLGPTTATPSAPTQINSRVQSPLYSDPLGHVSVAPPVGTPSRGLNGHAVQSDGFDPLGQARPNYMSQSVRVTPTRQRLDAREAASKLANMF
jgi:hypothetical protein